MTGPTWSASQRRSAATFGFILGDGVAGAYDGWSRPPTSAAVDLALHDPGPLQATECTTRLLDAVRRQGSDPSAFGPLGRPPALSPGHDDAAPAGGHGSQRAADDIVVADIAAGIVATSPARAAEAARYGVPIDGVASPLAVSDAAGVLAAAVGLAVTARLPSSTGSIADEIAPYAHTTEIRQQLPDVPAGYLYVDGAGIGDVGQGVLRDRRVLAEEGVVVVFVTVDLTRHDIVTGPEIVTRGWVYAPVADDLLDGCASAVRDAVTGLLTGGPTPDIETLQRTIRRAAGQYVSSSTKRRPMIVPVVIEV